MNDLDGTFCKTCGMHVVKDQTTGKTVVPCPGCGSEERRWAVRKSFEFGWTVEAAIAKGIRNSESDLLIAALVKPIDVANEGVYVEAIRPAYEAIVKVLLQNPKERFNFGDRKLEEFIAAMYETVGYSVILTPRSGDKGFDVIAEKRDMVSIRIVEQVKRYKEGRVVKSDEVTALLGRLDHGLPNCSKGIVTTTAKFAPRILDDPAIAAVCPYRIEMVDGDGLIKKLGIIAKRLGIRV
jgi:predicted RNA-binding Zn-ribbon protein involved in translation (DUF1610 family)